MGMDIHTYICDEDGVIKYKDIWEGRNSDFFANLSGHGYNRIYDRFPVEYGLSENIEAELSEDEKKYCFDFRHIQVGKFIEWFEKYRPDITAGWCSKFEAWLYKTKGIAPEELHARLHEDDIVEDYEFIVVEKAYDCAKDFYDFFKDYKINPNYYLNYFFDN